MGVHFDLHVEKSEFRRKKNFTNFIKLKMSRE